MLVLLAAAVLMGSTLSAQVVPGMKYKELKDIYSSRDYVKSIGDPYSPFWSGIASMAVPGMGQLICGETGRGLGIIAGDIALSAGAYYCAQKFMSYAQKDADGNYVKDENGNVVMTDEEAAKKWAFGFVGVLFAGLGYDIWNIFDAVKVAKVKNMYYNDLQRRTMEMGLYPTFDYAMTATGTAPVAGLTLSVKF